MEHYNLEIEYLHSISIYRNSSSETIYISNFKPIKDSEIEIKTPSENLYSPVRINPLQYYAHIPVNDEGEIFVTHNLQVMVDKINYVIKTRMQSISLKVIAAFIGNYPKRCQEIDVELKRVVNLLQTSDFIDRKEIQLQANFLCDIGQFNHWKWFTREDLLSKDAEQKIRNAFITDAENRFPSDIVIRANADVITASISDIKELISHPEGEWFPASTEFHRKLLEIHHQNNLFDIPKWYFFRGVIDDLISPVIEIERRYDEIRYFIAKGVEFKEFLQNFNYFN